VKTGTLGATGISIPKLVLGGNVFGWTADKAQSFRLLDAAFDHGLRARTHKGIPIVSGL